MPEISHEVSLRVESVVRESYGRLLAYFVRRTHDVAAAEDALADGLRAALETWPSRGIPANPEAWLLTTARRKLIDSSRQKALHDEVESLLAYSHSEPAQTAQSIPDERLTLLFTCAHPAIDPSVRTPLMLHTVLGLDAAQIAAAFLVSPSAMARRLSRAKNKISTAGFRFSVPESDELPPRLESVLESIYAAYATGWLDATGTDIDRRGLAREAVWLAQLVTRLLPSQAEAWGLLSLLHFCESRRHARLTASGTYVPLNEQDPQLWDRASLASAELALSSAAELRQPGRFQIEAAIQSVHADRARTGDTRWDVIAGLYDELIDICPALGIMVSRAAAVLHARGAASALAALDAIDPNRISDYQPYWAVRGHVLTALSRIEDGRLALTRAIGLTTDPAVREYLLKQVK